MREAGRVSQGFYPTQDRIVAAISKLFAMPESGTVTIVDPCSGCGAAIATLKNVWSNPNNQILTYGIEGDRHRAGESKKVLDSALWSNTEDATLTNRVSLNFLNPPYDRIRGASRLELIFFQKVSDWTARGGYLCLIVPDYILADERTGLAVAVDREYDHVQVWRYPEPEYSIFKQCVLIGRRRQRALPTSRIIFPMWAEKPSAWQILPDDSKPIYTLPNAPSTVLQRQNLSREILLEAVAKSPIRNALLREALAPAPKPERPLMPLKEGHLALALAGGLCDGITKHPDTDEPLLVKGTLESKVLKAKTKAKIDDMGNQTGSVDYFRTTYVMNVRFLRSSGDIENYSSHSEQEKEMMDARHNETGEGDEDDDDAS